MKKIVSISFFFLVSIILFSCSSNQVDEEQIRADLNDRFSEQEFIVNSITIDKAKQDEKQSILDITATMTAPNADITRMYRVTYDYYDKGGWILEECEDINTDEWTANPYDFDISTEELADMIFYPHIDFYGKGYKLAVTDSHYSDWTSGTSSDNPAQSYIEDISYEGDMNSGALIVNIICSARSEKIKISETISQSWHFDAINLKWKNKNSTSISHSQEISSDIAGTYYYVGPYLYYFGKELDTSKSVTLAVENNKLYITENNFNDDTQKAEVEITGLFGEHDYGRESALNIDSPDGQIIAGDIYRGSGRFEKI